MKFYHGSPKKLEVIKPQQARGENKFQNQKAIFLTKSFKQSALFALGKSLKGITPFGLPPKKLQLVIEGNFKPAKEAYVYEIDIENAIKGNFGNYEYAYLKPIKNFRVYKIRSKDYKKYIKYTKKLK